MPKCSEQNSLSKFGKKDFFFQIDNNKKIIFDEFLLRFHYKKTLSITVNYYYLTIIKSS